MYSWKILRLVSRNPFTAILLQAPTSSPLYFPTVFIHANADPSTALVILHDSSDSAIDAVDFINQLLSAGITRYLLDVIRYSIDFLFKSFFVRSCPSDVTMFAFSFYDFEFIAEKAGSFSSYICNQCLFL